MKMYLWEEHPHSITIIKNRHGENNIISYDELRKFLYI